MDDRVGPASEPQPVSPNHLPAATTTPGSSPTAVKAKHEANSPITWRQIAFFLLLPFVLAGALLCITTTYYYVRIHTVGFAAGEVVPREHIASTESHAGLVTHHRETHLVESTTGDNSDSSSSSKDGHYTVNRKESRTSVPRATSSMDKYKQNDNNASLISKHTTHVRGDAVRDTSVQYSILRPDRPLLNESVRNPALRQAKKTPTTPTTTFLPDSRRYVLEGLVPGRRYMLRLCFLGSPSVWYEVNFLHVQGRYLRRYHKNEICQGESVEETKSVLRTSSFCSSVTSIEDHHPHPQQDAETDNAELHREVEYTLMDTEVRMFSSHAVYPHRFAHDDLIIHYEKDEYNRSSDEEEESEDEDDDVYAVIEVIPHTLALCANATRFAYVSYNIHLDPLVGNWVPKIVIPYLICFSILVAVLVQVAWLPCLNRPPQKRD